MDDRTTDRASSCGARLRLGSLGGNRRVGGGVALREARIAIGTSRDLGFDPVEPESAPARTPETRRRRVLIVLIVITLVSIVGGWTAARFVRSPEERAAEAKAPARSVISATVDRRVLTDTVVLRGTVAAEHTVTVAPRVSTGAGKDGGGTTKPVVTGVRVRAGDVVEAGQVLLEVSGRPIFVLPGELPVYRDLRPGGEGRDVEQLQAALKGLGYGVGTDRAGTYGAGTRTAVAAFYRATGYEVPVTGEDDAIAAAEDRVTGAERALARARDGAGTGDGVEAGDVTSTGAASTAGESTSGESTSSGSTATSSAATARQVRYANEDLTRARTALAELRARSGAMVPAAEVVFLSRFPARVDTMRAVVGDEVEDRALTLSVGDPIVRGSLAPHEKNLVRPGLRVRILVESSGIEATGEVRSIADTPTAGSDEGPAQGVAATPAAGGGGYPVIVVPTAALDPELAGREVRLSIEATSSDGPVLVVPVSAVSAGADGRTMVTVLESSGARRRVEIRAGTSGDGYVEVAPMAGALSPGDRVVVGANRKVAAPVRAGAHP
ncbi:peptidoglycan-binding protein [Embleya sp. NPDC050154]|uniref:peptidoglycan-binding protein n=1 Tax=Embleya sp. NPDC050154 TaxID=3363988 RepID=UPI003795BC93